MQQVMAQIREVGQLDRAAQEQLLENLQQTTPDLWPLVVQQFRAALAYRQQLEAKDQSGSGAAELAQSPKAAAGAGEGPLAIRPDPVGGADAGAGQVAPEPPDESPRSEEARPATAEPGTPDRPAPVEPRLSRALPSPTAEASQNEPIVAAGYQAAPDGLLGARHWRDALDDAIAALGSRTAPTPQSDSEVADHVRLRMLYLLAGRRDEALVPVPGIDQPLQAFWSRELFGLGALLDSRTIADPTVRAAEAQRHLAEALAHLGETAPLIVRNLAFVTRVDNYGTFTPFDKYEFRPEQRVILYAEIENFKSKETPQGYHTALKSSYQIFDSRGQRVADHEFSANEEYCRNRRRDFFIGYGFSMPRRIYPGKYVLQLTVADLNSQKIGQSSIEFTIADTDQ